MSFAIAVVQFKPRKGNVAGNFATLSGVFAQLIAAPEGPPQLIVLPEAALTGYFLEGGVYESSFTADGFVAQLDAAWRAAGGVKPIDVACGDNLSVVHVDGCEAKGRVCGGSPIRRARRMPTPGRQPFASLVK